MIKSSKQGHAKVWKIKFEEQSKKEYEDLAHEDEKIAKVNKGRILGGILKEVEGTIMDKESIIETIIIYNESIQFE